MTDWLVIAILGTVVLAGVNVLDSHLIGRRLPSLRAFLLPVTGVVLVLTLAVMFMFPLPAQVSGGAVGAAVASGIIRAVSIGLLLSIYRTEEVSWAIPLYHTYPVFVALMAVPLLGESLILVQWLAIGIIVGGTVLLSMQRGAGGGIKWRWRPVLLLMLAAVLNAGADVASKHALGELSFWNMYWIGSLCLVVMYLAFSLRKSVISEIRKLPRFSRTLAMIIANEILAMTGILLVFQAIASGPVSLVSAITGARPIFVFILAMTINRLLPGVLLQLDSSRGAFIIRLAATLLIGLGIAMIYLS